MVELNGVRIWAIGRTAGGQLLAPRKLACGTLADRLGPAGAPGPGTAPPPWFEVPGRPDLTVPWVGWFRLALTGEVVGIYGAVVEPVGGGPDGQ